MPGRPIRLTLAGVTSLLVAAAGRPADPPPPDPANDPLPAGAVARCGVTRPILRGNPAVALVPPAYTNFLAPTLAGGVRRYDLGTGRPLEKAADADGVVAAGRVVVSADGRRAAVSRPGTLNVVDAATGKRVLAVEPPDGVVLVGTTGAALSADGSMLAYGGRGKDGKGEVVVVDVTKNEVVARFETAQQPPVFPTLSADGKTLVSHGPPKAAPSLGPAQPGPGNAPPAAPPPPGPDAMRTAQVWDVTNLRELFRARVSGMDGVVVAAAFSPDGTRLAASAGDGPVDVWDVGTGKRLHTLLGRKGQGVRVAFSPDGKKVASVGPDYRVQMWAADGTPVGVSDAPPGLLVAPLTGLAFVDNDKAVAWQTAAQFAVAWDAPTGQLLSPFTDHTSGIRSIAVPPGDVKDLFSSGLDGRVFRWEADTGRLREAITLHPARIPGQPLIRPVVYLSADATLATWTRSPAEVFDMATGQDAYSIPPPSAPPAAVGVIPAADGNRVVTVAAPSARRRTAAAVVWELATQRRVAEIDLPTSRGLPLAAVSPTGARLATLTTPRSPVTGQEALTVTGWDLKTGAKLGEVEDPTAGGSFHLIAADEATVVLASTAGRLWPVNFETGRVGADIDKLPVRGDDAANNVLAVSPDGKRIAIGAVGDQLEDYAVRVYDWPAGKRTHTFVGHLGPVTALRFGPDGKSLASGAQDTSVLVWDVAKPQPAGK